VSFEATPLEHAIIRIHGGNQRVLYFVPVGFEPFQSFNIYWNAGAFHLGSGRHVPTP
jgi:hypothetical protein